MCYLPSVWNHSTVHYTVHCTDNTKAKISCKTSMFKPSAQDFLTPFGTLQWYTMLFDSFTDFSFHFYATLNFFSIMVRLTDVQRGRAIVLLMQGQRQQQVANHFGVNVSTIERLVRRLRETGHLADWPRSGRPHVTTSRQDNPSGTFAESSSHCYRNCP